MPLPHFTTVASHNAIDEVIYKNLYEVTVVIPTALQSIHPNSELILLENITKITFPKYPDISTVDQRFKYSTRVYLQMPDRTSTDFEISLNVNQNDKKQVDTFRLMKDWYDLVWNNEDGSLHYKKNILGDITVHGHDKEGHVIRRVTYHNVQIKGFSGWEDLSWDDNGIVDLSASFAADFWEDFYY